MIGYFPKALIELDEVRPRGDSEIGEGLTAGGSSTVAQHANVLMSATNLHRGNYGLTC